MAADLHRWTYEALSGHHNLESLLTMKEQLFVTTTPTPLSANLYVSIQQPFNQGGAVLFFAMRWRWVEVGGNFSNFSTQFLCM